MGKGERRGLWAWLFGRRSAGRGASAGPPTGGPELLCEAVEGGDLHRVGELLALGVSPNCDPLEAPPLWLAVRGCGPGMRLSSRSAPGLLHLGIEEVNDPLEPRVEIVRALLSAGADPAASYTGTTPLHVAAASGATEVVALLLGRHVDVNLASELGRATPLHMAAHQGHVETVRLLVESGADVEARGSEDAMNPNNRSTPLFSAAAAGRAEVVRLLLSLGANAAVTAGDGSTPLTEAAGKGHTEVVELLRAHTRQGAATGDSAHADQLVDLLTRHIGRLREAGPNVAAFLSECLLSEPRLELIALSDDLLGRSLRDGQDHWRAELRLPVCLELCSIPAGRQEAPSWFSSRGGLTKVLERKWNSAQFRETECTVHLVVFYGEGAGERWVQLGLFPVGHAQGAAIPVAARTVVLPLEVMNEDERADWGQ